MDTLLLRVEDAARRLAIGRTAAYQLVQRGELPSITIGKSRRVPAVALEEFVARKASEAGVAIAGRAA